MTAHPFPQLIAHVSLLAFLTACAVGPDYQRPDMVGAADYGTESLSDQTVAAQGAAQRFAAGEDISATWWNVFRSEDLNKVVEQALTVNPDIEAAEATLRVAYENSAAAYGGLFPSLSGSFDTTRQKTAGASSGGRAAGSVFTVHGASVGVSYALDVFGGTRRVIEDMEAKEEYQSFQLEAARLTISSNVVAYAVQEASLRAQIEVTRDIIAHHTKMVDLLKAQEKAGAASESSVLSQVAALEQARATLPNLEKQLAQTRHALSALLGLTPDRGVPAIFDFCRMALPTNLPVSVPVKLIEQRPDVRAAEANLRAASAEIGIAMVNRLPGIKLSGSIGTQANTWDGLFAAGGGIWSLGGSVAQTIFDAGTLAHKQGAAEAAFDVAKAQYRKTILTAFQDVADVLHALHADAAVLKAQDAAYRAAENSFKLTKQQYDAGAVSYIVLLDAQRVRDQSRLARIQAMERRYADTAALFQAMGGGWWNRKVETPPLALTAPTKPNSDAHDASSTIPAAQTVEKP